MTQADSADNHGRKRIFQKPQKRTWPVTAVGLLLLLQAAGLLVLSLIHLGVAYLTQMGLVQQWLEQGIEEQLLGLLSAPVRMWVRASLGAVNEELLSRMSESSFNSIGLLFIALSAVAVLAAISFLRMERNAWTVAMLVQGLSLLMALLLYFSGKPWYVYVMMLYDIPMVLYLNYREVRTVFQSRPAPPGRERRTWTRGRRRGD